MNYPSAFSPPRAGSGEIVQGFDCATEAVSGICVRKTMSSLTATSSPWAMNPSTATMERATIRDVKKKLSYIASDSDDEMNTVSLS